MSKGFKKFYVYGATINCVLGSCFFGYIHSVMNPLQEYFQKTIYPDMSDNFMTLTNSLVPAGAAIGAFTAGNMAMRLGRRKAMMMTDLFSVFAIILTLIYNPYFLLVGRLFSGLCVGMNSSLAPLYLTEMSPLGFKGFIGTFTQVAVSVGILIAYLFGLNVPVEQDYTVNMVWWRFMFSFGILLAVVRSLLLLFVFRFETPKFLLYHRNEETALKVLAKIYHEDQVQEQFSLLQKEKENASKSGQIGYLDLFSHQYRSRFIIGCLLSIFQQIIGVNAIIYYSTTLFKDFESTSKFPQVYTVIVGIINLASAMVATLAIKKAGRKNLLLAGTVVVFASLILLPIVNWAIPNDTTLSKYFIFIFIAGFGFSLGSVTWLYVSEILPDIGVGIATLLNWATCVLVVQTFPYMLKNIGASPTFLIFASICFAGFIFILKWIKETKGKQPHEIALMFLTKPQDHEHSRVYEYDYDVKI